MEHQICPKCHSESIEFLGEVEGLNVDAILNHNKMREDAAVPHVEEGH